MPHEKANVQLNEAREQHRFWNAWSSDGTILFKMRVVLDEN